MMGGEETSLLQTCTLVALLILSTSTFVTPQSTTFSLLNPSPQCFEFTPGFVSSLQSQYNPNKRVSLGVGSRNPGLYTMGFTRDWKGQGNPDHQFYSDCCSLCHQNASCIGYNVGFLSQKNLASGNTSIRYRCNLWTRWFQNLQDPWISASSVTYFPAAFNRPPCPLRPEIPCTDDTPATQVSQCPTIWSSKFIAPDDNGQIAPQFLCATKDDFIARGNGAIVMGRLLSLGANPSSLVEVFNTTPGQCVLETWNRGGEFFTWESCSKKCSIFQNNACNGLNGVENGFSPSQTAFSGRLYR